VPKQSAMVPTTQVTFGPSLSWANASAL